MPSNKKLTTEEFISKAKQVHGNRYDYSKTEYLNAHSKIIIVCTIHGPFSQTPNNHRKGKGCMKCSGKVKLSKSMFVLRANNIHKGKYKYDKVKYKNIFSKVEIICPKHGLFLQTPNNHLNHSQGCSKCAQNLPLNNIEFIRKSEIIHKGIYNYSKVNYINNRTKVEIICPEHGVFLQTPESHMRGGNCPICRYKQVSLKLKKSFEQFKMDALNIHGYFYDYSRVNYINSKEKVEIICPKHGLFLQTPNSHLSGKGCWKCNGGIPSNTYDFIEKAISIHGNKYSYSDVFYSNSKERVKIYCPEHGLFLQTAASHLSGKGCWKCSGGFPITTKDFIERVNKLHGGKYDYSKVIYKNGREKVEIICPEHGVFLQTPESHMRGHGCPICSGNAPLSAEEFKRKAKEIHGEKI